MLYIQIARMLGPNLMARLEPRIGPSALPPRRREPNDAGVPDTYLVPFLLAASAAMMAMLSIRRERWMARRLSRSAGEEFADSLAFLHACHRIRSREGRLARSSI